MKVEEIPSDELVIMTIFWHKAFNAAGCDPMCHCCNNKISVGEGFKLATVLECNKSYGYAVYFQKEVLLGNKKPTMKDYLAFYKRKIRPKYKTFDTKRAKEDAAAYKPESREVMLCDKCDADAFMEREIKILNNEIKRLETPQGGCFRINGKIVH